MSAEFLVEYSRQRGVLPSDLLQAAVASGEISVADLQLIESGQLKVADLGVIVVIALFATLVFLTIGAFQEIHHRDNPNAGPRRCGDNILDTYCPGWR